MGKKQRFAAKNVTGWKGTLAVAMTNYIEAGSIIAAASSLTMWQAYLNLDSIKVGLLSALSANALGAALGALIGGYLTDRYGRKIVLNYDLMIYMLGALLIAVSVNYLMLLIGTIYYWYGSRCGCPGFMDLYVRRISKGKTGLSCGRNTVSLVNRTNCYIHFGSFTRSIRITGFENHFLAFIRPGIFHLVFAKRFAGVEIVGRAKRTGEES